MCGIAGIFNRNSANPPNEAVLRKMTTSLAHRGPDDDGFHIGPGIGLGHRRLSIIDLATGHQPLYNEDRSVCVVFNGEIYNYQPLVTELEALGHVFQTRSDTEVIVHGWEQWGPDCLQRFRGMFAFAVFDARQQVLFVARDRLGVKPFYYSVLTDGTFIFGSELKALMAHPELRRDVDPAALEDYFALGYVAEPKTIFKGVHKLEPGHYAVISRGQRAVHPVAYWDVAFCPDETIGIDDALGRLDELLAESVKLRMIADVPLGAFLSGGVDSSAVVAMMASQSDSPVNTCAIGFDDARFNETQYAAQVASRYNTRHHERQVQSDDFGLIDALAAQYDEPFADSSAIPTYRVCELARERVTVALSGDGGDESFGGYRRYRFHLAEERMRQALPQRLRAPLFGLLGRVYPKADWAPRVFRAKSTFEALGRDSVTAYLETVSIFRSPLRSSLFSNSLKAELNGYRVDDLMQAHARRSNTDDPLALIQYLDMKTYLVGDINTKVDRASMAHSLEVREPLMDHVLVDWLARLPSQYKIRGGEQKWLLKKAMEPRLPHDILYRQKMGFAVPLARWFRGPLAERVRQSLLGDTLASTGWFNTATVARLVEEHQKGLRDHSAPLWTLLMFEAFMRQVMDVPVNHALERGAA